MADLAISITGKLIEVLTSEAIKDICRMWGYKDELVQLKKTIITIKNVLLDAESKRDLSEAQQGYIAELKDVVYDADDLFDEFRTLVELNRISGDKGGKFIGKVRRFFASKKGKLSHAHRMSRRVEEIKGHLDSVANNYLRFGFNVDSKAIVRRREDSCSYVDVNDIIGRDKDKDAIIDMLLAPTSDSEGFCFLTIVGVGGLGKTALVQLVFNDDKIEKEFSSSRLWVCVSDQEGVQFDVKTILSKILEVVTKKRLDNGPSKEWLQNQFREQFRGKKYLLVLDDVWNEDHDNWMELKKILMLGARGSKIVVTSRSEKTGSIIGKKYVYKLCGLSKEDSHFLFKKSAFEEGEIYPEKAKIGENITLKCCGIPLAIKVVGSLLFDQNINKWQSIERSRLTDIGKGDSCKILSILKLSYHNLSTSLKSCFSYCAIFPKDFHMNKEMLISLWMAQGYVVPLDGGQSVEDAAEEHFSILMQRCFFQDIKKDAYGNVISVKIHDLMHDVAQEVGKEEICIITSKASNFGEKIRHVNISGNEIANNSLCGYMIRTYICSIGEEFLWDRQIENLTTLRVLDLSCVGIESLPQPIDNLLLLRYLNLSKNYSLEVLPISVTRLYNLQTLVLRDCISLREVPKDVSNLINLRHLDLYGCDKLNEIPFGILKLTNIKVLPYFVVRNEISYEELKVLQQVFTELKGQICINNMERGDSESMKPLVKLRIDFGYNGEWIIHEGVLEKLEVPPYLNALVLSYYCGRTIPWPTITLPQYLLHIEISECRNLEQLPMLCKLPYLKSLKLKQLDNMEYMESRMSNPSYDTKAKSDFFPSLESLEIEMMKKLKGWWNMDFPGMRLRFPRLSHLKIEKCSNFISIAPCSNPEYLPELQFPNLYALNIKCCPNLASNLVCASTIEKLELTENSERLVIMGELSNLREMVIDDADHIKLLPPTNKCLTSLFLTGDIDVECAIEYSQSCASSIPTLKFCSCKNMGRLPRLEQFIALEQLTLTQNDKLSICEEDEEPWKFLSHSLRQLKFTSLPKMTGLPKGMQHLYSLRTFQLSRCYNLKGGLPEWISCLSSLQSLTVVSCPGIKLLPEAIKDIASLEKLYIRHCPYLEERCKKPNGEDFPKIQHIPDIWNGFNIYRN